MRNKVALVIVKAVIPVMQVLGEVHLLGSPERGFGFLVHLPNLGTTRQYRRKFQETKLILRGIEWGRGQTGDATP